MAKENEDFNTEFVKAVKRHAFLYNCKHKDYHDTDKVLLAWENIAKEAKQAAKECKVSWKNVGIVYIGASRKPQFRSRVRKKTFRIQAFSKAVD